MTKCPHCKKELFHTVGSYWNKEIGTFDEYVFECYCIKYHTLYNSKIPGFSKVVTDKGQLISIALYLPEQYDIYCLYMATNMAEKSEPATYLYGLVTNEKSKSKYKVKTLITKTSEIKDLTGELDITKLRAWAETLAIFS